MTSVAFASTLRHGPHPIAPEYKIATYQITGPTATTSGGDTMDVSADMTYVHGFGGLINDAITEGGYRPMIVGGTLNTTHYGYPAATVKLAFFQSAGSNAAMDEADGVDLSGAPSILLTVFGK